MPLKAMEIHYIYAQPQKKVLTMPLNICKVKYFSISFVSEIYFNTVKVV